MRANSIAVLFVSLAVLSSCAACGKETSRRAVAETLRSERNPKWAQALVRPGLPNLHQIAPGLYRGAQPEPEGFTQLAEMGVKTIVNLRAFHSDEDEIDEAGLAQDRFEYIEIEMHAWNAKVEDVERFLTIIRDSSKRPVFVHCLHGADRTGTMSAVYRIIEQGWSAQEAIDEMRNGGFGFHEIWPNLPAFLESLDVERLRAGAASSGGGKL